MKLISVIVPVYNTEKYIEKCVMSILNQTYKKLEIILIDDGSTDNSLQICDSLAEKDNRITVIHQLTEVCVFPHETPVLTRHTAII